MLALIRTLGPVAAVLVGLAGGTSLAAAGAWAFNEWVDNPHVRALAAQKERDACIIRTMDAANRAEAAERERQRLVLADAVSAYQAAIDAGKAARQATEAARDQERADYEKKLRELASATLLLAATLSGCAANRVPAVDAAGARIGTVNAGAQRVYQPEECREDWPLLERAEIVGREKLVVIDKYEAYITDTINPGKRRCWQFNERILAGVAGQAVGAR